MNTSADWSGTTRDNTTVGEFSNVISSANEAALPLGGNVSLLGLLFDNYLNDPITIANTGDFTLTLGSSGIDMSAANQNVTINSVIGLPLKLADWLAQKGPPRVIINSQRQMHATGYQAGCWLDLAEIADVHAGAIRTSSTGSFFSRAKTDLAAALPTSSADQCT